MSPAGLPERPDLDQLRRQAKELKIAALAGDPVARQRLRGYAPAGAPVTLAMAQLVIARELGFASWAKLKAEVETRVTALDARVGEFLQRSLIGSAGAVRMLRADPAIAGHDIRTAAVLGEVDTVGRLIAADPAAAVRVDEESGWPPLLYVCMSRWHRLALTEPGVAAEDALWRMRQRAAGMVEVTRLLLDAGADPNTTVGGRPGKPPFCSPLYAAAGRADNAAITAQLLEHGARPDDHTVYLSAFHANPHRPVPGVRPVGLRGPASHDCLRLLLSHHRLPATTTALAAPISLDDAEGVQMMLDSGADPNHPLPGHLLGAAYHDEPALTPVLAAIRLGCAPALVGLLLERGGEANGSGPDGLTPYRTAIQVGRPGLTDLLLRHGAREEATPIGMLLTACADADRDAALRLLDNHPGLLDSLTESNRAIMVAAADRGATESVRLMLELGFPADTRAGSDALTPLHAAARSGSADLVRVLLDAGADVEARDSRRDASPLSWAVVGSAHRLGHDPNPDRPGTIRALLDAGADPEQAWAAMVFPEREVARLLVERGINVPGKDIAMMRHSLDLGPA